MYVLFQTVVIIGSCGNVQQCDTTMASIRW